VSEDLQPWCKGCKSHHVAPMLWRYGGVKAGVKLDAQRRYVPATPGASPPAADAVIRFLHFYGPADAGGFAEWAGIARSHAARLWQQVEDDLSEVSVGKKRVWRCAGPAGPRVAPGSEGRSSHPTRRPLPAEAQPGAPRWR
jgi:hypothetical protein